MPTVKNRALPMSETMILYSGVLLLGTFISAVSQVILKKAALKTYPSKIREYLNFPVVFSYSLFLLTTFMCIFAYRAVPLSFGPVLESTSYLYVTVFGVLFFKERITKKKVVALMLILLGVVIYSFGI